jgi:hypothetical protein
LRFPFCPSRPFSACGNAMRTLSFSFGPRSCTVTAVAEACGRACQRGRPSGAVCGRLGCPGLSLGAERALAAWPGDAATAPWPRSGPARAGIMAQGVRRREVLQQAISLEVLKQMGRELLARWRAVLLSLHRDRERLRRFVRAVQAQILTSPPYLVNIQGTDG